MGELHLIDVTPATLPRLQTALESLAADLGDPYRADAASLSTALFGPHPSARAVLALDKGDDLLGAAMFSPVVSTSAGGAGAYISDLWVAPQARGQAIGRVLLGHVARRARDLWQARFLRLASYLSNPRAGAFYARLGFAEKTGEAVLQCGHTDFESLLRDK